MNRKIAVLVAAVLRGGVALAVPSISLVTTDYTSSGVPLDINIVGSGFTGLPSTTTVMLGGLVLGISGESTSVITAKLPGLMSDGTYLLTVTNAPGGAGNTVNYSLPVAVQPSSAIVTPMTTTTGAVGMTDLL
jgi:hypothetical protein